MDYVYENNSLNFLKFRKQNVGLSKDFLDIAPKAQSIREQINKLDFF